MTTLQIVLTTEKRDVPNGITPGALSASLKDSTGAILQTVTPDESGTFQIPNAPDSGDVTIEVTRLDSNGTAIGDVLVQAYSIVAAGTQPVAGAQYDAPVSMVVSQV